MFAEFGWRGIGFWSDAIKADRESDKAHTRTWYVLHQTQRFRLRVRDHLSQIVHGRTRNASSFESADPIISGLRGNNGVEHAVEFGLMFDPMRIINKA